MVTSSSRTRMKKVNFRQKLTIAKGSHLLETSTPLVAGDAEFDGQENHDSNLGVDSGEISEHHLQAALSSTQLASDSSDQKKASYHIPTPSANGVLSAQEAAELYPPGVYQDPVSYVRFSDTVEDCIRGPSYNLDEDDADWLEEQNTKAKEEGAVALRNYRPPSTKKGKEKAKEDPMTVLVRQNPNLHIITEDEFEMVMTIFERVSKELVPYAHLDKSNLPTFEDLQSSFEADSPLSKLALPELPDLPQDQQATSSSSTLNSSSSGSSTEWSVSNPYRNLHILKPIASRIYPWWKQRREEREGKGVEPTLNFDESNDNDPYVCFRRREVKMMRKTRKTDALHIEKLIRLQSELEQASVVLSAFAQRERGSRAALQRNRSRWDALRDGCDPKRVWEIVATVRGLDEEEEERREEQAAHKRRRREQEAGGKSGRRRAEEEAAAGGEKAGLGSAILERVHAVQAYIEKECQLKASFDVGWEEATDVAFQPIPAPAALRSFRPISSDMPDSQYQSQFQQQQSLSAPRAGRPPSFRRRVGRGGRIFLDRKLPTPSPVPSSLNDWARHDQILEQDSIREQEHQSSQGPFSFSNSPSSRLQEMAAPPTGPFAFLPTVRPTLLGSPSQPPEPSKSGPFAGPFSQSQHSDASSTSSESSARSGTSLGGTSVSTLPTEADEVDIMAIDSFDKLEDQGQDREEEEDEEMQIDPQEEMERWSRLQERWRYDDEAGRWAGLGLCGLGGMEDDEEAVLDDFDQRFLKYRIGLLEEIDLMKLGTDSSHLAQARAAAETPTPQPIGIVTAGGMMNMGQVYGHRNSHGGNPSAAIQAQQAAAIAAAQAMARQSGSNNPLTALQQQQQMHSQQLLLQQQQAAQQRAAQQSSPAPSRRGGAQGSQPHPLSQSHSFSSSPNTNQIQQQQAALQQLRQAAAAAGSNQQQLPQGFPNGFPNGNGAGSPPLQSHLVGGQGPSSPSPVPMQQNGNRNQQQQQQQRGGGMNGMNFNGLTAEQLQAVLNGAAANGASNNPNLQAQIAAMKAAVASNPNLQLKLPPNRAMQIAQQMSNLGMNAGNNGMNGNNNGTNGRQHSNSPGYAA